MNNNPKTTGAASSVWGDFVVSTIGTQPRSTAAIAVANFRRAGQSAGTAVDLGCGAGNDSIYLARAGWDVAAMDSEAKAIEVLTSRIGAEGISRVQPVLAEFSTFKIPPVQFINASYSLPFAGVTQLDAIWDSIRKAIIPGGRFAGHFFGPTEPMVTEGIAVGVDANKLREMFRGFEIEFIKEETYKAPQFGGADKMWHTFSIVAQRRETTLTLPKAPMRLYHMLPKNLQGDFLMPLNLMRQLLPERFVIEDAKYVGREVVKETPVYLLNCRWNDVLHFFPFHPYAIKNAFEELGLNYEPCEAFEVDPDEFGMSAENTVIFRLDPFRSPDEPVRIDEYSRFTLDQLSACQALPALARAFYEERVQEGVRPLLAYCVPHVLHLGKLRISDLKRVLV